MAERQDAGVSIPLQKEGGESSPANTFWANHRGVIRWEASQGKHGQWVDNKTGNVVTMYNSDNGTFGSTPEEAMRNWANFRKEKEKLGIYVEPEQA